MSASLVGSEMCIRDRSGVRQPPGKAQETAGSATTPLLHPMYPRLTSSAVSYTHLTLPTICSV
eukprot:11085442-Alexandrium_andersonii.AAC.1